MNVFNNLFERHFQNTLLAHGWPADLELDYSLRYCQGDGCAFYGKLGETEILTLLRALQKDNRITAKIAGKISDIVRNSGTKLLLERKGIGYRYSHANTIQASFENYPDDLACEELLLEGLECIRDSIELLCSVLENDGYKIHERISPNYEGDIVMSRSTANFEIVVTESEVEFWDTSDTWDNEYKDECIAGLLNGKYVLKNLEIIVRGKSTGAVYGKHYEELVHIDESSPVRRWFEREWLSSAVEAARLSIEEKRHELINIRS